MFNLINSGCITPPPGSFGEAFNTIDSNTDQLWVNTYINPNGTINHDKFGGGTDTFTFPYFEDRVISGLLYTHPVAGNYLTVSFSAGVYQIDAQIYNSLGGSVIAAVGHPTFDRIDLISVDTTGTINLTPGVPAAIPSAPSTPPGELLLGYLIVPATATAISTNIVFTFLGYNKNGLGPGVNPGDVLTWNGGTWVSQPASFTMVPQPINWLTDVNTVGPVNGQVLVYNAGQWVNQSIGVLTNGTVLHSTLRWNGSSWVESVNHRNSNTASSFFGSTSDTGFPSGSSIRQMWVGDRWAFRAGNATGTQWDAANIGNGSVAFGQDNVCSAVYTFGAGAGNSLSANYAVGFGQDNTIAANSNASLILGQQNTIASGSWYNLVQGYQNTVSNSYYNLLIGNQLSITNSIHTLSKGFGITSTNAPHSVLMGRNYTITNGEGSVIHLNGIGGTSTISGINSMILSGTTGVRNYVSGGYTTVYGGADINFNTVGLMPSAFASDAITYTGNSNYVSFINCKSLNFTSSTNAQSTYISLRAATTSSQTETLSDTVAVPRLKLNGTLIHQYESFGPNSVISISAGGSTLTTPERYCVSVGINSGVNLPANPVQGAVVIVIRDNGTSVGNVIITGSHPILGNVSYTLNQPFQSITLMFGNSKWFAI